MNHQLQPERNEPYIEFQNVSKAFGDHRVLEDVSFHVLPGETLCILGRSGVGKSVSLHHIMGFLKPDSGRVIVAFEDITDYKEDDLERIRKKVTMVFQNGALFDSLTVGENVAFPLRERRDLDEAQVYQIVDGLLEMVGVKAMRDLLPSDLSTGMKRSVAIARALAAQPECILYDEPTTMVDLLMASLLGNLIQKLKDQLKLTSVVVTHDMRLAKKLADRIVFLHEGRAIFVGTGFMQKHDAVGQFLGQAHIVRHHDAGELELVFELLDEVAEQGSHQRVHHGGGLVVENAFRLRSQGTCNRHAAFHPGGKIGGQKIAHGFYAYHFQQAIHDLVDLGFIQVAALAQRKGHIFADGQRIEQCAVLEYHGHLLADTLQVIFFVIGDVF